MAIAIMIDLNVAQKFGGEMELWDRLESRADHATMGLIITFLLTSSFVFSQHINTRFISVKKGQTEKFEKGVAKKTVTFNSKEGDLRFYTFMVNDGENMGNYMRVRYEDDMKGFDKNPSKEAMKLWNSEVADVMTNMAGRRLTLNKTASHVVVSPFSKPLRTVMEYNFKGSKSDEFWRFRNNVAKAVKESGADIFMEVWNCGSGCNGNMVMVVFGHNNYEGMGIDNSVEWEIVYNKYNELNGDGSYDKDISNFAGSLEMYGRSTYTMTFMPELSSPEVMSIDKLYTN